MATSLKERKEKVYEVEKTVIRLVFSPRQWWGAAIERRLVSTQYTFTAVFTKPTTNTKYIHVDRIECAQPEPAWVQGERQKVATMLQEAVEKAVGKPTQQLRAGIIEWEVNDGQH